MPQIPQASDIRRYTPNAAVRSGRVSRAGQIVGNALVDTGNALGDFVQRETQYQVEKARAGLLENKAVIDNDFGQDNDYKTIPDRYEERMQSQVEQQASLIDIPSARQQFIQAAGVDVQRGVERMQEVAWAREVDVERAAIDARMVGLREAVINGDVYEALETAQGLISDGTSRNYMREEEAGDYFRRWRDDALKAKIYTMDPEDRLEALSQPWADEMPSDLRAQLVRQSSVEATEKNAQVYVDAAMDRVRAGEDAVDVYASIRDDITDPDQRKAAETRLTNELNKYKQLTTMAEQQDFDNYYMGIINDNFNPDEIPPEEQSRLGPQKMDQLRQRYMQKLGGVDQITPVATEVELNNLLYSGDVNGLRAALSVNADQMNGKDVTRWNDQLNQMIVGDPAEPPSALFSAQQNLTDRLLEQIGHDNNSRRAAERLGSYRRDLENWNMRFQQQNGREPSDTELQSRIEAMTSKVPTEIIGGRFRKVQPAGFEVWGELDVDQRAQTMAFWQAEMPEFYEAAVQFAGGDGDPTAIAHYMEMMTDAYGSE